MGDARKLQPVKEQLLDTVPHIAGIDKVSKMSDYIHCVDIIAL